MIIIFMMNYYFYREKITGNDDIKGLYWNKNAYFSTMKRKTSFWKAFETNKKDAFLMIIILCIVVDYFDKLLNVLT